MPSSSRRIILLLQTASPYHRKIAQGVATFAHEQNGWAFHVIHDPTEHSLYFNQDPLEVWPDLRSLHADGIITALLSRQTATNVRKLKIPVVGIEAECGWGNLTPDTPFFATDNEAIGRMAAEEFLQCGLKHLAYCGVPRTRFTGWSEVRQKAFSKCAVEAGASCFIFTGEPAPDEKRFSLDKQLSAWLKTLPKPVGLMACYDIRARHVLTACQSLGILVPEEVAVIGVDNDELMCELANPPLSSIEQGARRMGYEAARLLDRLISGQKADQIKHVIQPERIVLRRSSDFLDIPDAEIAAAVRFIRQKACTGIRVYDVVRAVAVARSALEVRFKNVMGRTIHSEIQRLQVERARQLVAATNLPLKDVAKEAGFAYVQHMTTIFRRYTGHTPGEYRKLSRA